MFTNDFFIYRIKGEHVHVLIIFSLALKYMKSIVHCGAGTNPALNARGTHDKPAVLNNLRLYYTNFRFKILLAFHLRPQSNKSKKIAGISLSKCLSIGDTMA